VFTVQRLQLASTARQQQQDASKRLWFEVLAMLSTPLPQWLLPAAAASFMERTQLQHTCCDTS
jgi:hypothetical protein